MWLMMIFWRTFRGMWRLVIGLIIGVVLYIITFSTPSLEWIFNGVYAFSNYFIDWLSVQTWFHDYEKWNNLVKPGDRLPLILYILVGRFIWLLFEAALFTFPLWLIFGRDAEKKTPESGGKTSVAQLEAQLVPSNPPNANQGLPLSGGQKDMGQAEHFEKTVVPAMPASVGGNLTVGLDNLEENAEKLERSIDEALERIKHVGEQQTS